MPEPIRVLIADDHPLFREGVAHSLASDPVFEILAQVCSGEEAIDAAARLVPDVALLDVTMPGIGGIAAAERIADGSPHTRIIMLTVEQNEDSLLAALKAGAHGYVLKGVSASELRSITKHVAAGESYVTPDLAARMLVEFARPRPPDVFAQLTPRESAVLTLLSQGLTNRDIGARMHLAEKTVKHYVTNVLQKLQVNTRTEAAVLALRHEV